MPGKIKKLRSKIKKEGGKAGEKAGKIAANPYLNFALQILDALPALAHGGSVKKKYAQGGGVRKTKMMDY